MIKILEKSKIGKRKAFIRTLLGKVFSFKSAAFWYERTEKVQSKRYKSNFASIPSGRGHYFGEMHDMTVFQTSVQVEFENLPAKIPTGYDSYLRKLYGDYMTLPPEEKRERHFILNIDFGDKK